MGKIGKAIGSLLGGGSAPKVQAPKPIPVPTPIDPAPIDDIATDAKKAKTLRAALYSTAGGAEGQEILSGGVSKRPTLLGN